MKRLPLIALCALALGMATDSAGGGGKGKALLNDEQFVKFVNAEGKYLQEELAKGKPDRKESRKIVASTMLLMAYAANSAHPDKDSVRGNAADLFDAFAGGDLDKAKSLAAAFYPKIQKRKELAADKLRGQCKQIMAFFASDRIGGFAVEKELEELQDQKDKLSATQFDRLTELGQKIGTIAATVRGLPPDDAKGKKDWEQFTGDFSKAALGLTSAAQAKNEAGTRQALETLGKTCTKCHDVYR